MASFMDLVNGATPLLTIGSYLQSIFGTQNKKGLVDGSYAVIFVASMILYSKKDIKDGLKIGFRESKNDLKIYRPVTTQGTTRKYDQVSRDDLNIIYTGINSFVATWDPRTLDTKQTKLKDQITQIYKYCIQGLYVIHNTYSKDSTGTAHSLSAAKVAEELENIVKFDPEKDVVFKGIYSESSEKIKPKEQPDPAHKPAKSNSEHKKKTAPISVPESNKANEDTSVTASSPSHILKNYKIQSLSEVINKPEYLNPDTLNSIIGLFELAIKLKNENKPTINTIKAIQLLAKNAHDELIEGLGNIKDSLA